VSGLSADSFSEWRNRPSARTQTKSQGYDLAQVRTRAANGSEPQANIEPFVALHLDPDQF
jgi:hypothetical protein